MSFCSHCGSELPEGSRFCARCGSKITASSAEETQFNDSFAEESSVLPCDHTVQNSEILPAAPQSVTETTINPQQLPTPTAQKKTGPSVKTILIITGTAVLFLMIIAVAITVFTVANNIRNNDIPDVIQEIEDNDLSYDEDWIDEITDDVFSDENNNEGETFPLDADYIASFFAAELPDSWEGHCTIYENNDGNAVTFVNTENEDAGYGGTLVTIARYTMDEDISFLPNYQIIATDSDYDYIAVFPTDTQYDSISAERSDLYLKMSEDIDYFLENLTFF